MAKRRVRKKRPASSRRGQRADEPPPVGGAQAGSVAQGGNLRRLTLSSWAVVAQVLRLRRDQTTILDLLGFLDWLGESNLERILRQLPPLPCRFRGGRSCLLTSRILLSGGMPELRPLSHTPSERPAFDKLGPIPRLTHASENGARVYRLNEGHTALARPSLHFVVGMV